MVARARYFSLTPLKKMWVHVVNSVSAFYYRVGVQVQQRLESVDSGLLEPGWIRCVTHSRGSSVV
jgi:hypothetical protein